jgi:hypothetical protein
MCTRDAWHLHVFTSTLGSKHAQASMHYVILNFDEPLHVSSIMTIAGLTIDRMATEFCEMAYQIMLCPDVN